jgi:hypothetical protein
MAAKTMLVITNASGEIIAACVEDFDAGEVTAVMAPAHPEHKLYRITDVPEHITTLRDASEFRAALTKHFRSEGARVRLTTAAEYSGFVASHFASKRKKAAAKKH